MINISSFWPNNYWLRNYYPNNYLQEELIRQSTNIIITTDIGFCNEKKNLIQSQEVLFDKISLPFKPRTRIKNINITAGVKRTND
jgi:hypothetical protein